MPKVVIGVDPHKRLNAVVVVNAKGTVLARQQFPNTNDGFRALKVFWRQWRPRTWAIEGCNGVGKYLAQRLVAEGEQVVDVSTRRAALVRVYAGGNGRKNDDTDAHSIALVALHSEDLPVVRRDELVETLRLLSPDTLPGVGFVAEEGSSELVRVRAFHVTDEAIARLCREFAPVTPLEVVPRVVDEVSAA